MYSLHSSPLPFGFLHGNSYRVQHFGREVHDHVPGTTELLKNVGFPYSSDFPSAIEMLEELSGESGLGLISEYQISFS